MERAATDTPEEGRRPPDAPVESEVLVSPEEKAVDEAALVHAAADIPYRLEERPEGWALLVPSAQEPTSRRELATYAAENPPRAEPVEAPVVTAPGGWLTGVLWALALVVFHELIRGSPLWVARGASDAARVLQGEPWRAVTALTLHGDFAHALANAAACVVFVGAVARWIGPGLGSLLFVLSGAGGNLVNAWLQSPRHVSLGASTATFGAIGILGALQFVRRWRGPVTRKVAWTALAASLGLFAMLGTSVKTDVGAHLAGLAVGAILGTGAAVALRGRPAPGGPVQAVLVGLTATGLVASWLVALR